LNYEYTLLIYAFGAWADSLPGSGWLALVDARFDVAAPEIQPYVAG